MSFDLPPMLAKRANLLRCLGKFEQSAQLAAKAFQAQSLDSRYPALVGQALAESADYKKAIEHYRDSLHISPKPDLIYRKGLIHERLGELGEAKECYQWARELSGGEHAVATVSLAYMELIEGNYERAWRHYEARWLAQVIPEWEPHILNNPRWAGQRDSVVLVYAEQGMGDTIQFVRYAHLVAKDYGCKVYLEVQKPLVTLLRQLPYIDHVWACGDSEVPADIQYVVPMLSLPLALGLNTEEALLSAKVPYLHVDTDECWDGLSVGLCWSGGQRLNSSSLLATDRRRDISLHDLACLADFDDIDFVSLQYGAPNVQAFGSPIRFTDKPQCEDFHDLSQLIASLDVVVTIDTAVAHLAGAMGKTTLLLTRFDPCWRWRNERTSKLCYPTVELFQQRALNDWSGAISKLKERLIALRG